MYPQFETIIMSRDKNVTKIIFNQTDKLNAMNKQFFDDFSEALRIANLDKDTTITLISHNGKYFSSGIDFEMFKGLTKEKVNESSLALTTSIYNVLEEYVYHKKPMVCVVKGPGIDCGLTFLGIHDYTICSNNVYFYTPLIRFGLPPICFTSYIFPRLMGSVKAKELLLFGKKITAYEAKNYNIVNEVVDKKEIERVVEKKIKELSSLDKKALASIRNFVSIYDKEKLLCVGKKEMDIFRNRLCSDFFYNELQEVIKKLEKK
uniref:Enoyl-CoA delta isomerase 2, mitochondrial (inferred by orthology to a human protein) n=1 Tax=Strongyloides venezuelensis TaxID=75913 RepID=A0A0K0FMM3_STRVS